MTAPELVEVAVRAFAEPVRKQTYKPADEPVKELVIDPGPSDWVLIFDTETKTDAAQQLRMGFYQLRHGRTLTEEGCFTDDGTLTPADRRTVAKYTTAAHLPLISVTEFRALLYRVLSELNGTIVGFNLPWDISRIALDHATAKGLGAGGFTFGLFEGEHQQRLQVRHLNQRSAFIRLTSRYVPPRSFRKRQLQIERHGYVVDLKTAAGAILGGTFSLKRLADHLKTEHRKLVVEGEHDRPLTKVYLDYARTDVLVSWECYAILRDRYESYGLSTPLSRIYSAAGLAKAVLKDIGVRPLLERQPDFSRALLGKLMSTYHGGRAEVHERRVVREVFYLDVHSEYPSVCILQGLWRFVIAERTESYDATEEVRQFLAQVTLDQLRRPDTWRKLTAIVEIQPNDDVLPTRARYGDDAYTIGVERYTSTQPRWLTLADCAASTIRTGRPPTVRRAIGFRPVGVQQGLTPIDLLGKSEYRVDPVQQDLYRAIIDLRDEVKAAQQRAEGEGNDELARELKAEQEVLKEIANSGAYGIFLELNVRRYARPHPVLVYGTEERPFRAKMRHIEEPGRYFDPLLGTLITGAGRLLLMLAEVLGEGEGLSWLFCDTDSWALAKPVAMDSAEFRERALQVQAWFDPLNPYTKAQPLFKIEEQNYALDQHGKATASFAPLYGFAVAAKRNSLFNLDAQNRPLFRKVSAHGLGHLRAPYPAHKAPEAIPAPAVSLVKLDCDRWQHDLWFRVIQAALDGHAERVELRDLPGFAHCAASRYAATTPELLMWFGAFNEGLTYWQQVRPFGFLLSFQHKGSPDFDGSELPQVVAPYDKDPERAARRAFDRATGQSVERSKLRTYREALAQYHLHSETKFLNGLWTDSGTTRRRHASPSSVTYIGKEANDWEVQYFLGVDETHDISYGPSPRELAQLRSLARKRIVSHGVRVVARATGLSIAEVSMLKSGSRNASVEVATRILRAELSPPV